MKRFAPFVLVSLLCACSTTRISVHTNPAGADIYARPVGNAEFFHMGKTPIYLTNSQLTRNDENGGAVQIDIRMEGFKNDSFIITEISRLDLHLNRELEPKRDFETQVWMNSHITQMFEIRQMVQDNRYKEALVLIRRMKEQTPMVATLHQLEGGVQLLLKDYASALAAYRIAAKLNPEDAQAVKMVRHLERTYGYRRQVDLLDSKEMKREPSSTEVPQ